MNKWIGRIISGLIAFCALMSLTSFQVYWGESSLLTSRAWVLGGSHPPGYPMFLQAVRFFQFLFVGDIAYRSNIAGCLFLAVTGVFTYFIIRIITGKELPAWTGAVVFCCAPSVINSVAAVEVYSLNLLFVCILTVFAMQRAPGDRTISLMSFLTGLFLTHHLTIVMVLPGLALLYMKDIRSNISKIGKYFVFFLLGLSVFIYLPIRESVAECQVWGSSDKIAGFIDLISATEESSGSLLAGIKSLEEVVSRTGLCLRSIFQTVHWIGMVFVCWGFYWIWKHQKRIAFFSTSAFVLLLTSVSLYKTNEVQSFFLPGLFMIVLWFSIGINKFYSAITGLLNKRKSLATILSVLISVAICTWPISLSWSKCARDVVFPRLLAVNLMDQAGTNGLVISSRSDICFLLWYLRDIEHRSGAQVIFQHLLSFKWYYKDIGKLEPGIMNDRLLAEEFEDSWSWNRSVTASVVRNAVDKRDVWVTEPKIISDLQAAGLKDIYLFPEGFCARLKSNSLMIENRKVPEIQLAGRFDQASIQALAKQYYFRSRFYALINDKVKSAEALQRADRIRTFNIE